jgi:hypothetical protein
VKSAARAKLDQSARAIQRNQWLDKTIAAQALNVTTRNYGNHFAMPEWWGRARKYFADLNSPEALAYSDRQDAELAACDKKWADFQEWTATIPLPPQGPRLNLDDETRQAQEALKASPDDHILQSLCNWLEVQAEKLADRVAATVEVTWLAECLAVIDKAIEERIGIPQKSEVVPISNSKIFLRENGARRE